MSRLEEREDRALSSLHDISDYSNYIDQRISKLNNLYQSLTITHDKHPSHRHQKYNPYQSLQQRTPSLTRQPPQQILLPFQHSQAMHTLQPPQSISTFDQRVSQSREKWQMAADQMYRTEYVAKKNRYSFLDQKSQIYADLKSLTHSNFHNSLEASRTRLSKHEESKPANKKLQIYKQIKNEILGTFYVGGRTLSHGKQMPIYGESGKQQLMLEQQRRGRRGKLWHGRPPVKIIQKYE